MKKLFTLLFTITLSLSLIACSSSNELSGIDKIKEKGTLVMATSPDYPPYEFKVLEDGKEKIVGFDIEIAKEIAKDLGVTLHILPLDFKGLLLELNSNKADIIMSGMSPTKERAEAVDFSTVYYYSKQCILISAENKDTFTTLDSLDGKNIGVQKGSIQEKLATEQIIGGKFVALPKVSNLITELNTGNLDAVMLEVPVANGYIVKNPNLALADIEIQNEDTGSAVAIKKGNTELVDSVNATLVRLESEGLIDKFVSDANIIVDNMAHQE